MLVEGTWPYVKLGGVPYTWKPVGSKVKGTTPFIKAMRPIRTSSWQVSAKGRTGSSTISRSYRRIEGFVLEVVKKF